MNPRASRLGERARGQTLVMFALTLLLLSVMVCLTLSMGSRVKERMEMQTLADASAYSSAVATARAYNAVAVMNRVQVAHAVSTLGTLSLISWSTLYWKHADNAADLFMWMSAPYGLNVLMNCFPFPPRPLCKPCAYGLAQAVALAALARRHASLTKSRLQRDTELFRSETLPRWNAAQRIHDAQVEILARARQKAGSGPGGFARQYLDQARLTAPSEVNVQGAGATVTDREMAEAVFDHATPARGGEPFDVGHIVMASRGHPFIYNRRDGSDWDAFLSSKSLSMRGYMLFAGGHVFLERSRGKSYYDATFTKFPSGRPYDPRAHDGAGGYTRTAFVALSPAFGDWIRCASPVPAYPIAAGIGAFGKGTGIGDAQVSTNQHNGVGHGGPHAFQTFPPFVDFNGSQVADPQNLHGQPKMVSALSRDYVPGRDVWDLSFKFQMNPAKPGETLNLASGQHLGGPPRQVAVGSGIVYYHRYTHSAEPPNLFAPYWRAGLTRYSVDRPDPGNPARPAYDSQTEAFLAGTGATGALDALRSLRANGYVAW